MGRRSDADVVFVHNRGAEDKFTAAGEGVKRFDANNFIIVGPEAIQPISATLRMCSTLSARSPQLLRHSSHGRPLRDKRRRAALLERCWRRYRPNLTIRVEADRRLFN
jgi:ABC-type tungstate transport system permease subunit